MSKMDLRSATSSIPKNTTTSAYENPGSQASDASMSPHVPKILRSSLNVRKRKRKTSNGIADHKTALLHRAHSCSKNQPGLSRAEESKVAPMASRTPGTVQDPSTSQLEGTGEDNTETKLDDADDEAVIRIRRELVQLGTDLRENARKQIRCIGQVDDINESPVAIDADPFWIGDDVTSDDK